MCIKIFDGVYLYKSQIEIFSGITERNQFFGKCGFSESNEKLAAKRKIIFYLIQLFYSGIYKVRHVINYINV